MAMHCTFIFHAANEMECHFRVAMSSNSELFSLSFSLSPFLFFSSWLLYTLIKEFDIFFLALALTIFTSFGAFRCLLRTPLAIVHSDCWRKLCLPFQFIDYLSTNSNDWHELQEKNELIFFSNRLLHSERIFFTSSYVQIRRGGNRMEKQLWNIIFIGDGLQNCTNTFREHPEIDCDCGGSRWWRVIETAYHSKIHSQWKKTWQLYWYWLSTKTAYFFFLYY